MAVNMTVVPEDIETRERLNKEARSVKIFSAAFNNEYRRFDHFSRNLATGKANFGNTTKDWIGIGAIGVSAALINTAIGVMATVGVITGLVPAALGLGVALLGVGINIAYRRHLSSQNKKRYQATVDFIEQKKMDKNIHYVQSKISHHFANYLNHCSAKEAREFAKKTHDVVADAITNGKVKRVSELVSPAYMALYKKQIPTQNAMSTKNVLSVFARLKASMVNLWNSRKRHSGAVSMNTGFGLFDATRRQESEVRFGMEPKAEVHTSRPRM